MNEIIRPMTVDDLPLVHALECAAQQDPWSQEHFAAELGNPFSRVDLCWRDGELAGFICTWLVAGEVQIQNVATAPACPASGGGGATAGPGPRPLPRGRFRGRLARGACRQCGGHRAVRAFGFHEAARRPGYYPDGEDALVMCLENC